jgi:hypothetical protein
MILDALRMNVNSTRSGEVVEPLEHLERLERWEQFIREIVSTTFRNGRIPRDGAARRAPRRGENSISNDLKLFSWTSFRRFASSRKSSGFFPEMVREGEAARLAPLGQRRRWVRYWGEGPVE